MNALDKARELGAQHGRRDAIDWGQSRDRTDADYTDPTTWPEPDLLTGDGTFAAVCQADIDAYAAAYRAARDETIREAVR